MEISQESPRSVIGHEEAGFPRKRGPQDDVEGLHMHRQSKIGEMNEARVTLPVQLPFFHDEYLKNVSSQSPQTSGSMIRSFSGISIPGCHGRSKIKQNQDSLIMFEDPATNSFICACLDGHGVNGHKVSQIFKHEIESRLCSHPLFIVNIEHAIHEVLASIEFEIYRREARLADYSGTTVTLAVIRDRRVTVANIGDSRIILGKRRRMVHRYHQTASQSQSQLYHHPVMVDAFPLSVDHKPHIPMEHARILAAGGRVFSVRYEDGVIGPPRVWLGDANLPGLAMSRSLGDFVVHTAGVISRPDIFHYELHPDEDFYLIAATDGLWDRLQNQDVISMVHHAPEPHSAIIRLIQEIRQRWHQKEESFDDTTICVVQFHTSRTLNNMSASSSSHELASLNTVPMSPSTSCETSPVLTGARHLPGHATEEESLNKHAYK